MHFPARACAALGKIDAWPLSFVLASESVVMPIEHSHHGFRGWNPGSGNKYSARILRAKQYAGVWRLSFLFLISRGRGGGVIKFVLKMRPM